MMQPGGYRREGGVWHVRLPNADGLGPGASIGKHDVTEHDDGTITVSPSILFEHGAHGPDRNWHGYLEHGTWREV